MSKENICTCEELREIMNALLTNESEGLMSWLSSHKHSPCAQLITAKLNNVTQHKEGSEDASK